jgi:hypothetical protein
LVQHGEPVERVLKSVQDIILQTTPDVSFDLIIWVYAANKKNTAECYRNHLVACVSKILGGRPTKILSYTDTSKTNNVDQIIEKNIMRAAFALWFYQIEGNLQVYCVNSSNELLRTGTFWDFMQQKHTVPNQPLAIYLQTFLKTERQKIQTTANHKPTMLEYPDSSLSNKFLLRLPTRTLITRLKHAKLSWSEANSLAYACQYPDARLTSRSFSHLRTVIVCIPIEYRHMLASDLYTIVHGITNLIDLRRKPLERTVYTLVIQGYEKHSWDELEDFREKLTDLVKTSTSDVPISFASYIQRGIYKANYKQLNRQAAAVIVYRHWLENCRQRVSVRWRNLV